MHHCDLTDVELQEMWSEERPEIHSRSAYVNHWLVGSAASAAVVFELDPGRSFGRHRHSAEETIVVLEGDVEVDVGAETIALRGPGLVVAPALVHHDIRCVGETTARCLGFWPSASVVSVWDVRLQPRGSRRAGTPFPENI